MTWKELAELDRRETERVIEKVKNRMSERFYDDDPKEEDHVNDSLWKRGTEGV